MRMEHSNRYHCISELVPSFSPMTAPEPKQVNGKKHAIFVYITAGAQHQLTMVLLLQLCRTSAFEIDWSYMTAQMPVQPICRVCGLLHSLSRIEGLPMGCVQLLVVADRKTPTDWQLDGVEFLSMKEQKSLPYELKDHISYDTYA